MKRLFILPALLFTQLSFAKSIDGEKFVKCFEKAMNERIEEIQNESPRMKRP